MHQEPKKEASGITDFFVKSCGILVNKKARLIGLLIGIAIYLLLYIVILRISVSHSTYLKVFGVSVLYTTVVSVTCQLQIMVVIFILLVHREVGYIVDWIILTASSISSLRSFLIHDNQEALQGIVIPIFTLLVVIVLNSYVKLSGNKYKEALEQREEILTLYGEISASERTLIEQRNQLQEYNIILEEREEELNQLAFYDPLTSLSNRRLIIDQLDALLQISKTEKRRFSVVFVDLDNFKKINDTAGHQVGDEILRVIANRWRDIIHKNDLFGRLGGDEFAIIIQRAMEDSEIQEYVNELRESLNKRVYCGQREFYVKASFGVAKYPEDGDTSELLLKYADMAMYEAKAKKQNEICFFNHELHKHFQQIVQIEMNLQHILAKRELLVVYQPQYDCKTHELRGFEALARWSNSKLGQVSPKNFIPLAEETGMILPMGEYILRQACVTCKDWMDTYRTSFILSVNVSVVQLLDASFIVMVKKVLNDTGFPANYLEVEVTESTFISSMDNVVEVLSELKKMGIHIALDDFGTGYASLSYLQMLPIDMIKVDKLFVDGIAIENKQRALVKSLVDIAHELSMDVIAEGVEVEKQLEVLRDIQCDFIQGYLLGKPMQDEVVRIEIFKMCEITS